VFTVVEDQPELVGGMKALQEAVSYPELAKEAGIEGRVIVQFVVDKDGTVTNPKVTRGVHKLLNEAALQAVKQQEFKPGQQQGEPVKVQMSLPVTFRLPSSHSESATQEGILQAPEFSVAGSHPDIEGEMRAIQESLSYPEIVRKAGIEGTVHVTFTVDETGEVQNPQVTESVHEALDAEALSALKSVSFVPVERERRPPNRHGNDPPDPLCPSRGEVSDLRLPHHLTGRMVGIRLFDAPLGRIALAAEASVPKPDGHPEEQRRPEAHERIDARNSNLGIYDRCGLDGLRYDNGLAGVRRHPYRQGFFLFQRRDNAVG
jgi:TonB family protein